MFRRAVGKQADGQIGKLVNVEDDETRKVRIKLALGRDHAIHGYG